MSTSFSPFTCRLILCSDAKGGIGKSGTIPWNVPIDRRIFYDVTTRHFGTTTNKVPNIVILGKTTWKSIPPQHRGLTKRITFVLSKSMTQEELDNDNTLHEKVYLFRSFREIAEKLASFDYAGHKRGEIFVAGGAQVYSQAMQSCRVTAIYHTKLSQTYDCDVFFKIDDWKANLSNGLFLLFLRDPWSKTLCYNVTGDRLTLDVYNTIPILGNAEEQQYLDILADLINASHSTALRQTRNAPAVTLIFRTMSFDLSKSFPLFTTKRVFFRGVVEELLFFLAGHTDTKLLEAKGVNIWKKNTTAEFIAARGLPYREGDMGPSYGFSLRHLGAKYIGCDADYTDQGFDQIEHCLRLIKNDPFSRRIVMTTYDPLTVDQCVIPPCHGLSIMFDIDRDYRLSCTTVFRSNDWCCGNPFNVASYALLIHYFVYAINNDVSYTGPKLKLGMLHMMIHNVHLYEAHLQNGMLQSMRIPMRFPTLEIKEKDSQSAKQFPLFTDLILKGYCCHSSLEYEMFA